MFEKVPKVPAAAALALAREHKAAILGELAREQNVKPVCLEVMRDPGRDCGEEKLQVWLQVATLHPGPDTPTPGQGQDEPERPGRRRAPRHARENFKVAVQWLRPHLPRLLATGWTWQELFQAGPLRWPWGWGLAWDAPWREPGVSYELSLDGCITWTRQEPGRVVVQRSRPLTVTARQSDARAES